MTNFLVMLSGLIFQPLLGYILDLFWTGRLDAVGVRIYDIHSYRYAILTIPVSLLLSLLLIHFMKDVRPALKARI